MNPLQCVNGHWVYSGTSKISWIRLHAVIGVMIQWLGH